MNKKVLFILQEFPPPIVGGSIRFYKYSKYLSKIGWDISVICRGKNKKVDLNHDKHLAEDLQNVNIIGVDSIKDKIIELKNAERMSKKQSFSAVSDSSGKKDRTGLLNRISKFILLHMIPDSDRYLWVPFAYLRAKRLITKNNIKLIVVSSPPASSQIIALKLKNHFKNRIKLISDFRDLWSLSPMFDMGLLTNKKRHIALEKKVLRKSDKIIYVSDSMREAIIDKLELNRNEILRKSHILTNGYDDDDFIEYDCNSFSGSESYKLCYVGSVSGPRKNNMFPEGMNKYFINNPNSKLRVEFIGSIEDDYKNRFNKKFVEFTGSIEHVEALRKMQQTNFLLLLLTDDLEGRLAFTGKFFEYLKAKTPIFAIVPEGEISKVVNEHNIGIVKSPSNIDEIAEGLEQVVKSIESRSHVMPESDDYINMFRRDYISKEFDRILCETESES